MSENLPLAQRTRRFWNAVQSKDQQGIEDAYYPSEETYVILEGPRYSTIGTTAIFKGWKDYCSTAINLKSISWVEGPFEESDDHTGWIGGIIDMSIEINGKEFNTRFRCSFVYKMHEGDWKIRHEHVSAPMEDPYGIGDWLQP